MKRKICFVTIAVMVLSLIGCGSNADEYEYEEIYKQKEPECTVEVTFRLYLCSSDYAVQVVRVVKKENENG